MANQWFPILLAIGLAAPSLVTSEDDIAQMLANLKDEIKDEMNDLKQENRQLRTDMNSMESYVTRLRDEMRDVNTNMESTKLSLDFINLAPVGTIVAWAPYPSRSNKGKVQNSDTPSGWMPCDGSTISIGIWKGQKTPNLNGSKMFLRGGSKQDALKEEGDSIRSHNHGTSHSLKYDDIYFAYGNENWCLGQSKIFSGANFGIKGSSVRGVAPDVYCEWADRGVGGSVTVSKFGSSETKPKNVNVVFIMKIM